MVETRMGRQAWCKSRAVLGCYSPFPTSPHPSTPPYPPRLYQRFWNGPFFLHIHDHHHRRLPFCGYLTWKLPKLLLLFPKMSLAGVSLDDLLGKSASQAATPSANISSLPKSPFKESPPSSSTGSSGTVAPWFMNLATNTFGPTFGGETPRTETSADAQQAPSTAELLDTTPRKGTKRAQTAKPTSNQPGGRGDGPGKRGRKKTDRIVAADTILKAFQESDEHHEAFFGSGRSAQVKALVKLLGELQTMANGAGELSSYEVINGRVRRLTAAIEMLKIYHSKGNQHIDFLNSYQAQVHFLKLDEKSVAQNDFPVFSIPPLHCFKRNICLATSSGIPSTSPA